jgi:hypothetical protein
MNLPRDMIDLILDSLSENDIYNYGLTSKSARKSTLRIWKMKCKRKNLSKMYRKNWFYSYFWTTDNRFSNRIFVLLTWIENSKVDLEKQMLFEEICIHIMEEQPILFRKKFDSLRSIFKNKLKEITDRSWIEGNYSFAEKCTFYNQEIFLKRSS